MKKSKLAKIKESFNKKATLENLAYLIIFCLPFYLIKLDFLGLPTNLLEVLMVIFLGLFSIERNNQLKFKSFFLKNKKYLIGFSLIIIGLLISTLTNENPIKGLGIIKGWFILPFLFSLAVILLIEKEKRINIFKVYFFSASCLAIISLFFVFFGQVTFDNRLESIFNSPNYLAMYLAPALIMGLFLFKKDYIFKYFFWVILLSALFFTSSYLSWLAIIIAALILLVSSSKLAPKQFISMMVLMVFIFFVSALQTQKMSDLKSLSKRSSMSSRIMIWRSAEKMLSKNWFFGIGPSNFQTKYLEYQKYYPPYLEWAVPHPHSIYLSFWLYSGLVGFLVFLMMLFWWLRDFIRNKKRETVLGLISLGIILYFLLHGLADTTYFKNDSAIIFWLAFLSVL